MNLPELDLHELHGHRKGTWAVKVGGNWQLCLEPLNLTVTDAARSLGVSRKALSSIVNGHAGISQEMAVRLSIAFNTSAESWLNQQLQYDLWHAEKHRTRLHVAKLSAA